MPKTLYRFAGYRSRRKDVRRTVPHLEVVIDGETYRTIDWSLGGLLIDDYSGPLMVGEEFRCTIRPIVEGRRLEAELTAEVARLDERKPRLAIRFISYGEGAYDALEQLSMGRLRAVSFG